jgi:hypothetical protein
MADPEQFMAAAAALFARYPAEVQITAVHRIACRSDRPTLRLMTVVLEEVYAPVRREEERQMAGQNARSPSASRTQRTPEEQARIDAQVATWRKGAGVPEGGLPRRGNQAPMLMPASRQRRAAVAAECEARRIRNSLAHLEAGPHEVNNA